MLKGSDRPLWDGFDLALLDLDGVVYVGAEAVSGAAGHLEAARSAGMRVAFVTNNAARPPSVVADHLRSLGVAATEGDVVTSAQAAAALLQDRLDPGSAVFVIGGEGLDVALTEAGLRPVRDGHAGAAAVVSGYHPDIRWSTLGTGAILVRNGLPWVACNTDLTVPLPDGAGPGNGALVEVVARFSGRTPVVAGKPRPALFEQTLRRVGGRRPLVVGDRLDTDIEGAVNVGYDSLLVMTGVTGLAELVAAEPSQRPSYIAADLAGLGEPQPEVRPDGTRARAGGWSARVDDGRLLVEGTGGPSDWWRVAATAAWRHLDEHSRPVDVTGAEAPGNVEHPDPAPQEQP